MKPAATRPRRTTVTHNNLQKYSRLGITVWKISSILELETQIEITYVHGANN
jgi:hypothetical protein